MIHNKPNSDQEQIGYRISNFYLQQCNDDYAEARNKIENLRISDIRINGETVEIYLSRPGLLIGRKGTNMDALIAFVGKPIKIFESFNWNDILIPEEYNGDGE